MSELERIAEELRRATTGDAWHGDSLKKILDGVTAQQAASKPIANGHSMWELVLHVTYWLDAITLTTTGTPLVQHSVPGFDQMNFPPVKSTEQKAWDEAKARLFTSAEKCANAIGKFDAAKFGTAVPGRKYTYDYALPGIVSHTIYHGGQMAILKKAL
jgi:uncharacterized damage-inducible protein DinB